MIEIQGLTQKQMVFADILWGLNGRDQVDGFIRSLPAKEQAEAKVVLNMMVAAVFDRIDDVSTAQDILKQFRN